MKKKEKKADLEQLLNSLVEAWWKPRWLLNEIEYIHAFNDVNQCWRVEISYGDYWYYKALRQIVSKESWLWQFVCENGMYKKEYLWLYFNDERAKNVFYKIDQFDEEWDVIQTGDMEWDSFIHISEPEYRLIESALKDESELEKFLLSNIKVDG